MNEQTITIIGGVPLFTRQIQAVVVGQLALHEGENYDTDTFVTHIKSGCWIAAFQDFDEALDFAERANRLMDFDSYLQSLMNFGEVMAKAEFGEAIRLVRELRSTYESNIDLFVESPGITAEELKEWFKS